MLPVPTDVTAFLNFGLLALVVWAIDRASPRRAEPLYLQMHDRSLSGVCIGIARTSGIGVGIVRAGFVLAALGGAHALLAYVVLSVAIHRDPAQRPQRWWNRPSRRVRAVGHGSLAERG